MTIPKPRSRADDNQTLAGAIAELRRDAQALLDCREQATALASRGQAAIDGLRALVAYDARRIADERGVSMDAVGLWELPCAALIVTRTREIVLETAPPASVPPRAEIGRVVADLAAWRGWPLPDIARAYLNNATIGDVTREPGYQRAKEAVARRDKLLDNATTVLRSDAPAIAKLQPGILALAAYALEHHWPAFVELASVPPADFAAALARVVPQWPTEEQAVAALDRLRTSLRTG